MNKIFASLVAVAAAALSFNAYAGGNIEAGKALAHKTCVACHGADFNTPIDPAYPKLAGQPQDYLEHALRAYQRGTGPNSRNNAIMGAQVKELKRQDIQDIAAYLHSLQGSLVLRK
ncbi:MAG: cytochrome c [Proteobacteria bacterium]|nr:cytochrome c [Pseudomonadota bacterium]